MTVVEKSPARLILRDRPVLFGAALAAAILTFAGFATQDALAGNWHDAGLELLGLVMFGLAFAAFVRQIVLILDRPSGLVVLRAATLRGASEQTRPLTDLTGAEIETRSSAQSRRLTRLVLTFKDGTRLPVTPVFSSGPAADRDLAAVQAWLSQARAPLSP